MMVYLNISIYEGDNGNICYTIEPTVNEASTAKEQYILDNIEAEVSGSLDVFVDEHK